MPSPAQIEGRAIVAAMVPVGMVGPDVTIRARRCETGTGIALTVEPHMNSGRGGEGSRTVVLEPDDSVHRRAAIELIRHKVDRWVEVETVMRDLDAERAACDEDGNGGHVDDDMPTPAWRYHCPLVLRSAMDTAGLDDRQRLEIVETGGVLDLDGYAVRVHEVDPDETPPWGRRGRGTRTVRRVTIQRDGLYFSHGINRCYLKIRAKLPESMDSAAMGLPLRNLVEVPGMMDTCIQPWRHGRAVEPTWTEYDVVRCFSMMSPPPSLRTIP